MLALDELSALGGTRLNEQMRHICTLAIILGGSFALGGIGRDQGQRSQSRFQRTAHAVVDAHLLQSGGGLCQGRARGARQLALAFLDHEAFVGRVKQFCFAQCFQHTGRLGRADGREVDNALFDLGELVAGQFGKGLVGGACGSTHPDGGGTKGQHRKDRG